MRVHVIYPKKKSSPRKLNILQNLHQANINYSHHKKKNLGTYMVSFFRHGESFVVEYEYEWVDLKNA